MMEATLCGYCVELPEKRRAGAARVRRCPLCKTEVGVTASGRHFRVADAAARTAGRWHILLWALPAIALLAFGAGVLGWAALASHVTEPVVAIPAPPTAISEDSPAAEVPAPPAVVAVAELKPRLSSDPGAARPKPTPAPLGGAGERAAVVVASDAPKPVAEVPHAETKHVGGVHTALQSPPPPPLAPPDTEKWVQTYLLAVPELALEQPPVRAFSTPDRREAFKKERAQAKQWLADLETKIQKKNGKQPDGFILSLREERSDLAGLPFLLGGACQLSAADARRRAEASRTVRAALSAPGRPSFESGAAGTADTLHLAARFWHTLATTRSGLRSSVPKQPGRMEELTASELLPTLMQVLATEAPALRIGLIAQYRDWQGPHITAAFARLALYDPDPAVRDDALHALRGRPPAEATQALLDGLRHPWPIVAQRAAAAVVFLERTDLMDRLTEWLGGPDPCAPFVQDVKGTKVLAVRELVKVNHHRSCLLCHAPSSDIRSREVPQGLVPSPGEPLPPFASQAYYSAFRLGDTVARADVTYLRQDFSALLPVKDAAPWPEMQRFDFLIRTRVLTEKELQTVKPSPAPGVASPHHLAWRAALERLTALVADAAGPQVLRAQE